MINIEQCQMIAIDVRESFLRLVGFLLRFVGSHETLRNFYLLRRKRERKKHGRNGKGVSVALCEWPNIGVN